MDDAGSRNDDSLTERSLEDPSCRAMMVQAPPADPPATVVVPTLAFSEGNGAARRRLPPGELRPPMGIVTGAACGLASAVLYTLANVALRRCVGIDPFLVSAVKAGPTVLVLGPFIGWMLARGETIATSRRMVPRFVVAALIGQFVGNAAFQVALGMIGLAVAVPITLGMMIIGAAVLGRILLHEPVHLRTGVAMFVLMTSVVVLSMPGSYPLGDGLAESAAKNGLESPVSLESTFTDRPAVPAASKVWLGSLFAAASGAAYALFGAVMRQALTGGLSAPLTMFISGAVGTISLWSVTFMRLGFEQLSLVAGGQWAIMFAAGILNFTAFVALSTSLKSLPVVAVNLINASQVAMAAIAGILLFAEPLTPSLIVGIALTLVGLGILAQARRRRTK